MNEKLGVNCMCVAAATSDDDDDDDDDDEMYQQCVNRIAWWIYEYHLQTSTVMLQRLCGNFSQVVRCYFFYLLLLLRFLT